MRDYKQFFAICKKHGLDYKDKVAEFTEGRTDSLKALTDGEYKEMMIRLSRMNTPPPGDAIRKKIISMARQMGWVIKCDAHSKSTPLWIADMQRIDNWCLHYGKYKKRLNDHSPAELGVLASIFEEVLKTYLKGLNK
ncbi:MAG: hypothetical protein WBP45_13225 [Daejeonella sp.]